MEFNFIKFWNKHKLTIYFILSIILFLILLFIDRKKEYGKYQGITNYNKNKNSKWIWKGKNENKCKTIIEKYFQKPFIKIRPDFLKYKNGSNLELDMYNDELKLACEYNGSQHYIYNPFFHKTYQDFLEQQERDKFKQEQCKLLNIKLLVIPYTVPYNQLETFIINEIKKLK